MTELWQEIVAFFASWGEKWPQIILGLLVFLLLALLSKKLTELIGAIIRKLFTRWPKTGEDLYGALKTRSGSSSSSSAWNSRSSSSRPRRSG